VISVDLLQKYFQDLSTDQLRKYSALGPLYKYWNERINVISRKDIDHLYLHHVLHSLAIARFIHFPPASRILDVGTGGGFPGLPLAIYYPKANFTLVDSIGKKIKVVNEICREIECTNVSALNIRAEKLKPGFDFVISRAVSKMPQLSQMVKHLIRRNQAHKTAKGILALKGGNLDEELRDFNQKVKVIPLSDYFDEEYFNSKSIVYLQVK